MGFSLVPVSHLGDIVLQGKVSSVLIRAPTEGLDRDLEVLVKPNWVHDVPPIETEALLRFV
jgi:hypothetical protein